MNRELSPEQVQTVKVLQAWLDQDTEGQALLDHFQTDPSGTAGALAEWLRSHPTRMPSQLATYVSGGQVEKLINIAQAGIVLIQRAQSSTPPQPIWNVPYQRNPFFTGREEVFERLHDAFASAKTAPGKTQVLSGLGGIGKTQIAIEYTHRYRSEYSAVLWVRADSPKTLASDFVSLAYLLNLSEKGEQDQNRIIQAVKAWLNTYTGWLLIFDNVDELNVVKSFLPTAGNGHILLMTLADSTSEISRRPIPIEKIPLQEGILFLLRRVNILPPEAQLETAPEKEYALAKQIVEIMDSYPLALDQAGAYIEETLCSLSDYLYFYEKRQFKLLDQRGRSTFGHEKSIITTLSLSFQKVMQANQAAANLLKLGYEYHRNQNVR